MTDSAQTFAGPFEVAEHGGAVVLTRAGGDLELIFNATGRHDLPARLESVTVQRTGGTLRVSTAANPRALTARSVQVHEAADLYGRVIELPRFALGDRLKWSLLLWVARFAWGQALIGRLTRRKSL